MLDQMEVDRKYDIIDKFYEHDEDWTENFFNGRDPLQFLTYWGAIGDRVKVIDLLKTEFQEFYDAHKP